MMDIYQKFARVMTRRSFLGRTATGMGSVALASLLHADEERARGSVAPLHLPRKARRVIHLYMAGGPSHLETFDYKPKLGELHGQPMPESFTKGKQIAQLQGKELVCYGPQHGFKKYGKNGTEICELFPHMGSIIDEICLVRSMTTE